MTVTTRNSGGVCIVSMKWSHVRPFLELNSRFREVSYCYCCGCYYYYYYYYYYCYYYYRCYLYGYH